MILLRLFIFRLADIFGNTFLSNPVNKVAGLVVLLYSTIYGFSALYFSEASSFIIYALWTLGTAILADTILGSMLAIRNREFCLTVARASLAKIVVYSSSIIALIPLGYLVTEMGITSDRYMLLGAMALYLSTVEILSLMRLSNELGVRWPPGIKKIIESISKDLDSDIYIYRDENTFKDGDE